MGRGVEERINSFVDQPPKTTIRLTFPTTIMYLTQLGVSNENFTGASEQIHGISLS